jgi:acyl-CoA dehydrogenase
MAVPEAYGGGGEADFRFPALIIEEFCRVGMIGAAQGLVLHTNVAVPYVIRFGSEDQKARWLPGLCSGECIAAIAMTEPGTGSDLAAIATRATRQGDEFVVNGSKLYITNGSLCDLVIVVCRTGGPTARHGNLSLIVVECDQSGVQRGRRLAKIGQHASDTAEMFFDDVVVPATNLLGREDHGFGQLVEQLPRERLTIALTAVAHAEAAFGWTLAYCKERHAFGQPIGSFQNSRFALATMRTELDVAQVFVDHQIDALNRGELTADEAAESKWWCADLNKRVLDGCLQLHGGAGYMEETPIARAWRDGRAMSIYGGTSEVMKELIGRRRLGL